MAELKRHPAWEVLAKWLKDRLHHSWVDPRGLKKEDWEWAELNAYHSAEASKQILDDVDKAISDAEYLRKKEKDELDNKFSDMWRKLSGKKE